MRVELDRHPEVTIVREREQAGERPSTHLEQIVTTFDAPAAG